MSMLPTKRPVLTITIRAEGIHRIIRVAPSPVEHYEIEVEDGETGKIVESEDQIPLSRIRLRAEGYCIIALGEFSGILRSYHP